MPTPLPLMLIEDQPVIWQALAEYLTAQPEFNCLLMANSLEEFLRWLPAELAGPYSATNVYDTVGGRTLEVATTNQHGVQFYISNFLDSSLTGHTGITYGQHAAFCP